MRLKLFNFRTPIFKELPSQFLAFLDQNLQTLSIRYAPHAITATTWTFNDSDEISSLQVDATSAACTVYLPLSPTGFRRRTVIKTDVSANTVTISGNGALINGAATYVLAAQYDKVIVEPTGTGWLIV